MVAVAEVEDLCEQLGNWGTRGLYRSVREFGNYFNTNFHCINIQVYTKVNDTS